MTQYIVGLTHKTRSQALTIEAEDALPSRNLVDIVSGAPRQVIGIG